MTQGGMYLKEFKKLLQFANGYKLIYLLGMLSIILSQAFNTIGPLIIRTTIDSIVGNEPITSSIIQAIVNSMGGRVFLSKNL